VILDQILAHKAKELAERLAQVPLVEMERRALAAPLPRDFAGALRRGGVRLIAEIKRASPSKGVFSPNLDVAATARTYAANGASALSVLTDERFFAGSLEALRLARSAVSLPVLRKDFTIHPYHILEARAAGADAVLLIVAALSAHAVREFLQQAAVLGMAALVEVHTAEEVAVALAAGAEIIGINNRDLRTFHTDIATTAKLRPLIPAGKTVVSESGIFTPAHVAQLLAWQVDAMLVGEALVTAPDMAAKVAELVQAGQAHVGRRGR